MTFSSTWLKVAIQLNRFNILGFALMFLQFYVFLQTFIGNKALQGRAWVSTGATGAWNPPKFWTSPLAPADFGFLILTGTPQSSFYVTSGTLGFKFITQALQGHWTEKINNWERQSLLCNFDDGYKVLLT